jgi:hypothetical protein
MASSAVQAWLCLTEGLSRNRDLRNIFGAKTNLQTLRETEFITRNRRKQHGEVSLGQFLCDRRYCFTSAVDVFNFFLIQMPAAFFCKIGLISNYSVLIWTLLSQLPHTEKI